MRRHPLFILTTNCHMDVEVIYSTARICSNAVLNSRSCFVVRPGYIFFGHILNEENVENSSRFYEFSQKLTIKIYLGVSFYKQQET